MKEKLEYILVKICEKLPLNLTILEGNGICKKPNEQCIYCRKKIDSNYLCLKKTYTLNHNLRTV